MLALTLNLQNFLIDIKGPALAFLPVLAFEGGTRRNIPKFEVHTHQVIYPLVALFTWSMP
jgi:exosome complex component RRP40